MCLASGMLAYSEARGPRDRLFWSFDGALDALVAYYNPPDQDGDDDPDDIPVWDGVSKGTDPTAQLAQDQDLPGSIGTEANVLFLDRDNDGVRDPGEELLVNLDDDDPATPTVDDDDLVVILYQPTVDTFLHSGQNPTFVGPGQAPPADAVGTRGNVYLHDVNDNGRHDAGEDIWVDTNRNGFYTPPPVPENEVNPAIHDIVLAKGANGQQVDATVQGVASDVVFTDNNGDGRWQPGEAVWENADLANVKLSQTGIRIHDTDGDGAWTAGEAVWQNAPALDGEAGVGGVLHYTDANGNGRWDPGEPVWRELSATAGAVALTWNDNGCLTDDGSREYT